MERFEARLETEVRNRQKAESGKPDRPIFLILESLIRCRGF